MQPPDPTFDRKKFFDEHFRRMEVALKRAIDNEVARRRREGLPIHVWQDGKIVDLQQTEPNQE